MVLIKSSIPFDDFQSICRICLEKKPGSVDFNSIMEFQNIDVASIAIIDILQKIMKVGTFQENTDINLICPECINELKIVYLFTLKVEEANRIVDEFIKADVKAEIEEDRELLPSSSQEDLSFPGSVQENIPAKQQNGPSYWQTMHFCSSCNEEFTALQLRAHVRAHRVFQKYLNIPYNKRVSSGTKFSSTRHTDEPQQSSTIFAQKERKHRCPHCNEECPTEEFKSHTEIHRNPINYKCDKCSRVFPLLKNLKIHRVTHMKEFPFKCEHCQKGFVVKKNYDCHILTHNSDELPHECSYCFHRFSNPEHLKRHLIIHTENVTYSSKHKTIRCYYCHQRIRDPKKFQTHVCVPVDRDLVRHKRRRKLCSFCGAYVVNLPYHIKGHLDDKPFECDLCKKKFKYKGVLTKHLLIHSGDKSFLCNSCGKTFNSKSNLQVHERTHRGS